MLDFKYHAEYLYIFSFIFQQLGISLPGMGIVLPQSATNDESDEMLEAELLALMEEEAHDERPTKSKKKCIGYLIILF